MDYCELKKKYLLSRRIGDIDCLFKWTNRDWKKGNNKTIAEIRYAAKVVPGIYAKIDHLHDPGLFDTQWRECFSYGNSK